MSERSKFPTAFRGYSTEDVDRYLEQVGLRLLELTTENERLAEQATTTTSDKPRRHSTLDHWEPDERSAPSEPPAWAPPSSWAEPEPEPVQRAPVVSASSDDLAAAYDERVRAVEALLVAVAVEIASRREPGQPLLRVEEPEPTSWDIKPPPAPVAPAPRPVAPAPPPGAPAPPPVREPDPAPTFDPRPPAEAEGPPTVDLPVVDRPTVDLPAEPGAELPPLWPAQSEDTDTQEWSFPSDDPISDTRPIEIDDDVPAAPPEARGSWREPDEGNGEEPFGW